MKKVILYLIVATSVLGSQLIDGQYSVQQDGYYYGWASTTSLKVEDGKIIDVKTNKVNKVGELVSEDKKYNEKMLVKSGTNPKEYLTLLTENFMKNYNMIETKDKFQMPKVDIIAGATNSSKNFKKMMEFLVEKAKKGETGDYKIKL